MQKHTSTQEGQIAEALAPLLQAKGYDWLPRLHQFRRSTEKGFTCVILSLSPFEDRAFAEMHLGVRIDDVENLAFPFTNGLPGFQPDSMTLVTPIAQLFGQRYERFELDPQEGPAHAIQCFEQQLEMQGLAFLEQHNDLSTLEQVFNESPGERLPLVHNQINRCFRGLVMAKLKQRPVLDELAAQYGQALSEQCFAPQATLDKFDRLYAFLKHYSMN